MNNSPSDTYYILLLLERYHQNSLAVLAAAGMNGLYEENHKLAKYVKESGK